MYGVYNIQNTCFNKLTVHCIFNFPYYIICNRFWRSKYNFNFSSSFLPHFSRVFLWICWSYETFTWNIFQQHWKSWAVFRISSIFSWRFFFDKGYLEYYYIVNLSDSRVLWAHEELQKTRLSSFSWTVTSHSVTQWAVQELVRECGEDLRTLIPNLHYNSKWQFGFEVCIDEVLPENCL